MVRFELLLVTRPNEALVGLALAPPQLGWFTTSNNSVLSWSRLFSVTGKFLRIPRSHSQKPGLVRVFRGCTPNVPGAGCEKAALLNQIASFTKGVGSREGLPVRFQNWLPLPAPTPA